MVASVEAMTRSAPVPDFGKAASDYATHRAGFPDSFYDRLSARGIGKPGSRVVDLGTGTGTLARGFAARGCRAIGIDLSPPLLEQARALAARDGLSVEFREARAEETGLEAGSADLVIAGQCWHWFDRPRAAREVQRVAAPGGWLVIAHFDWIPLPGNVADATEALIRAHNPDWPHHGGIGIHGYWLRDLALAGFRELETFSYDLDVPYPHESWRGRIRASAGVAVSLPPAAVEKFDREHAALLAERFPGPGLPVLHRVFAVIARA
jgi:SAM-dependent methyltransferase